jgi:hypothetical protein
MKPSEFIHEGANDALIAALNKKHPGPCPHERVERMNANQVHCKDCGKMITTKPHAPITSPLGEGPDQRVKIISGPSMYIGKTGVIGQISQQHAKMYPGKVLVNLDHGGGSTLLPKSAMARYKRNDQGADDMDDYRNESLGEAKAKPAWRTWNPYGYYNDDDDCVSPEYFQDLSAAILSYVSEKFGGAAWFKGGSYAYKVDAAKPNVIVASDGSIVKCANVAQGLEDYCDKGTVPDFAEQDPRYWSEFFRPVKNKIPTARDGAPMYGGEQERHEIGEDASGGASCAGAIAAGPAGNLFSSTVKRSAPKKKKSAVGEGIDLVKEMWGDSDHAPDQMNKREEAKYLSRMKAGQKARNAKRKADTQTANRADRSSTPQSK